MLSQCRNQEQMKDFFLTPFVFLLVVSRFFSACAGATPVEPSAFPAGHVNLFAPVQCQIQGAVRPPSTLSQEELAQLEGAISFYVNEDGHILSFTWRSRSGNPEYDAAIEQALATFGLDGDRLGARCA